MEGEDRKFGEQEEEEKGRELRTQKDVYFASTHI